MGGTRYERVGGNYWFIVFVVFIEFIEFFR